jgi:predicted signal transduction protein with EAL and GGDEF domain
MWPFGLGPPAHWDAAMESCFDMNYSFCYPDDFETGLSSVQRLLPLDKTKIVTSSQFSNHAVAPQKTENSIAESSHICAANVIL